MARRPEFERILTKEELAELENNLLRLSIPSVEQVYQTAHRDCAFVGSKHRPQFRFSNWCVRGGCCGGCLDRIGCYELNSLHGSGKPRQSHDGDPPQVNRLECEIGVGIDSLLRPTLNGSNPRQHVHSVTAGDACGIHGLPT